MAGGRLGCSKQLTTGLTPSTKLCSKTTLQPALKFLNQLQTTCPGVSTPQAAPFLLPFSSTLHSASHLLLSTEPSPALLAQLQKQMSPDELRNVVFPRRDGGIPAARHRSLTIYRCLLSRTSSQACLGLFRHTSSTWKELFIQCPCVDAFRCLDF